MATTPPALAQDFLEFLPLFPDDDEDAILDRCRTWANEGLDPLNPGDRWVDTREGSHWYMAVMPAVRELARLYDLAGTEVPMSGMILWTWGTYLDDQAAVQLLTRLPATQASGTVRFSGPNGTPIAAGTQVSVDPAQPDDPAPLFQTTAGGDIGDVTAGILDLPVVAVEAGTAGNVAATSITAPSTPLPAGVTFTNPDPTTGGTDPETDEALRARLLDQFVGQGGGNMLDYKRWAEEEPGVGHATVIPIWNGPGTVLVIVTDPNGQPVGGPTVASLQARLDPVAELGHGEAPIGHTVTVETATALGVDIDADVALEDGYTLDGTGGTVALRQAITDAVVAYVETVPSGGEVVRSQIEARIALVPGVHDVTVNTPAANIPIAAGAAPKVPVVNLPMTLTEV